MRLVGDTRMSLIASKKRERSRLKLSMSARFVDHSSSLKVAMFIQTLQIAALKLRQKAVTDTASSFGQLTQLGY